MTKHPNPQIITVDGRKLVNRDWMAEHTGASRPTVNLWYTKRATQPEDVRHPEKAVTIDRVDFYDLEAFERFYAGLKDRKKKKVLPTDPALYAGDSDDLVSINDAAKWFGFAGPAVIRKYLGANGDYFPQAVGSVEGSSGRQIPAFRRADLQAFDRRRNGDNTGAAGSPGGPRPRERNPRTVERVAIALAYLREQGAYHRGAGAALAAQHGDPTWKWERAIKEARTQFEKTTTTVEP